MNDQRYQGNRIEFEMRPQPDDVTCGPTCLHGVYKYFGNPVALHQIRQEITSLYHGGTLAVCLGHHALKRGFKVSIYTYNLDVFDPTWFSLSDWQISSKLQQRLEYTNVPRLQTAILAYKAFLDDGGIIRMKDLSAALIRKFLVRGIPIITGLSSTYLYQTFRELPENCQDDDIRGEPSGHFVVIKGYDPSTRTAEIADPWAEHPFGPGLYYKVKFDRLITSILLGVMTYDANLLIIEPLPNHPSPIS
ncbi:MAG: C39 family peptidase [Verrucomicrobia bacterium]|nr:C39 family peptidase [Verrucomicrobiota bacterium]